MATVYKVYDLSSTNKNSIADVFNNFAQYSDIISSAEISPSYQAVAIKLKGNYNTRLVFGSSNSTTFYSKTFGIDAYNNSAPGINYLYVLSSQTDGMTSSTYGNSIHLIEVGNPNLKVLFISATFQGTSLLYLTVIKSVGPMLTEYYFIPYAVATFSQSASCASVVGSAISASKQKVFALSPSLSYALNTASGEKIIASKVYFFSDATGNIEELPYKILLMQPTGLVTDKASCFLLNGSQSSSQQLVVEIPK